MRAEMYCYWQVFGRCALILVKPAIRGQAVRREELPDRTWYHETSVCVDEGSGSSLERLGCATDEPYRRCALKWRHRPRGRACGLCAVTWVWERK